MKRLLLVAIILGSISSFAKTKTSVIQKEMIISEEILSISDCSYPVFKTSAYNYASYNRLRNFFYSSTILVEKRVELKKYLLSQELNRKGRVISEEIVQGSFSNVTDKRVEKIEIKDYISVTYPGQFSSYTAHGIKSVANEKTTDGYNGLKSRLNAKCTQKIKELNLELD